MTKKKNFDNQTWYFFGDTENTVPKIGEDSKGFKTHVWACGYVPVGSFEEHIFTNLEDMFNDLVTKTPQGKIVLYFHNLGYDGLSVIYNLMCKHNYALSKNKFRPHIKELYPNISDEGAWYTIRFKWQCGKSQRIIELRDSYKILPFSEDKIGKSLKTTYQKLKGEIDYTIDRPIGWKITDSEYKYLRNDLLIMSEALDKVKEYGLLDSLTIGAACLKEYYTMIGDKMYKQLFPRLDKTLDNAIRKSYRGGWCYVKCGCMEVEYYKVDGRTYDVNSEYPWAMHSAYPWENPRPYPIGNPIKHVVGLSDIEMEDALDEWYDHPFFVRVIVECEVKDNHLPFLQTSNYYKNNCESHVTKTIAPTEFTLAKPDLELFFEQYDVTSFEVKEIWVFNGAEGMFDCYIDKWMELKKQATIEDNPVLRQVAKLMLNNLYGKMGMRLDRKNKLPVADENDIKWLTVEESDALNNFTINGYIPVASFATAYARGKVIRAAQENYDNFVYADTDSMHLLGEAKDIDIDDTALGAWKEESRWNRGKFVRQKTYLEVITHEDGKPVSGGWKINIKAAGASADVKERLLYKVDLNENLVRNADYEVINEKRDIDEIIKRFGVGMEESGKLVKVATEGGYVLCQKTFKIR